MTRAAAGTWKISRRTLLRGLGAAVSLPLLEVMSHRTAGAESESRQSRMAYLYFPNGVAEGAWQPEKVGPQQELLALNRWMKPLEPFRDDLLIPRNMWTPHGNGHVAGPATWLTGGSYDHRRIDAGGASADQMAARYLAKKTLLPSLELSLRGEGFFSNSLPRNTLSWANSKTPAPRDTEPRVVFDRMFRVGRGSLSRKSVLDLVLADARRLKDRVSYADRRKVDEYLESVRAIERRIDFSEQQHRRAGSSPQLQTALRRPPEEVPDDHGDYMRQMLEMIVLAFWADATRVATFMLDHGQSNRYFNFIDGVSGTWHALSHWKDISGKTEDDDGTTSWKTRDEKRDMYNRVTHWHHTQFAWLLGRLRSIEESGASLLDNSMILYGSSLSDGHDHSAGNLPLLLAGRGQGTIQSGRAAVFRRQTSLSGMHLAMLQRAGLPLTEFGGIREPMDL